MGTRKRRESPNGARRGSRPRLGRRTRRGDALLDEAREDRIARVLRDALATHERQAADVQVGSAPAEHLRVERDHDRSRADRLRAADEALDELIVGAPVQLEPARSVAERIGDRLHRR